jgi:hypothetical protein
MALFVVIAQLMKNVHLAFFGKRIRDLFLDKAACHVYLGS